MMRRPFVMPAALVVCAPLIIAQSRPQPASLAIRNVTVIDGTGAAPRPAVNVLAREGRIAAIGPDAVTADVTIDGTGLFALPGLIDAHVHLSGGPRAEIVDQLSQTLRGGVTTVFDMAGDVRMTSDLARAAIAGEIQSPTIGYVSLFAGPAFFTDRRVVAASVGYRPGDAPWNREITADTDLARAVAEARGAGATTIKLYAALDGPTVRRIGDEAARQHVRLVAHATVFPAKPSDLVAAGVKVLAHAAYLVWEGMPPSTDFSKRARGDFASVPPDGPVMTALLHSMKEHHVALNPTLWIFADGPAKDDLAAVRTPWMNAVTKRAQELGVTIAAGVDDMMSDRDPLPLLHRELETLVTGAKLTPLQAIVAATGGAAHAIGMDDLRGTLAVGKAADLAIVDADPAADIRNTRRIRYVIKDGRVVRADGVSR
jgi:imidazolonepropionase-like amidohydrolase